MITKLHIFPQLNALIVGLLILLVSPTIQAATYWVSTGGNDGNGGTDSLDAWLTINRGDQLAILAPGDTINIMPGTYYPSATLSLNVHGTGIAPIVYRAFDDRAVVVNMAGQDTEIFVLNGRNTWLDGLQLTDTRKPAVKLSEDSCAVLNCRVSVIDDDAISCDGMYCLFQGNTVYNAAADCIVINVDSCTVQGNTVCKAGGRGIHFKAGVNYGRAYNNIAMGNSEGIRGTSDIVAAFNLTYSNGTDYTNGVADSAGGIASDPLFVDYANNDFELGTGSPAIDAGLDVGYPFEGTAPDMGALESPDPINELPVLAAIGAKNVTEHQSLGFTASATDAESIPVMTSSALPSGASYTDNGDGTASFEWTPSYPQAGTYDITFYATDDSLAVDSELVTITVNAGLPASLEVSPDQATISADSTLQYTIVARDAGSNEVGPGSITWTLTNPLGNINAAGFYTAVEAGTTRVVVSSDLGPVDTTTSLEITPGLLDSLAVSPDRDTISADTVRQFMATGYDADGNETTALGTLTWSVENSIGTIDNAGLFTAVTAGPGFINAESDLGVSDKTDSVFVVPGEVVAIDLMPNADTLIQDSTVQFHAYAYDSDGNLVSDLAALATWGTDDPSGSVNATGLYTAGSDVSPPDYQVWAEYGALADTGYVTVLTDGQLSYVRIEYVDGRPVGDTIISADNDTTKIYCRGYDSGDNLIGDAVVNWSIIGTTGAVHVSPSGGLTTTIEARAPGTIRIIADDGLLRKDTTGNIIIVAGALSELAVTPDSVRVNVGDTVAYTAVGYDADSNETSVGIITWDLVGRNGDLDSSGIFVATRPGEARVVALSSFDGLADSSLMVAVEELVLTSIPIGNAVISPNEISPSLLTFRLDNYFDETKTISSIVCRLNVFGPGNMAERLSNLDTVLLYQDVDNDSLLSDGDLLLGEAAPTATDVVFPMDPVAIAAGAGKTFFVAVRTALYPRDGDTVDVYLDSDVDIIILDGTIAAGPGTANSYGLGVIDGMIAEEIAVVSVGLDEISDVDNIYPVAIFDLPGNGYEADILNAVSVMNLGTADAADLDSLILLADNANNVWDAAGAETNLGRLIFTGDRWSLTGIAAPLQPGLNRFFLAVDAAEFPSSGRDLALEIPVDGIVVQSGNDGPTDLAVTFPDTVTIFADEEITVTLVSQPVRAIVPGAESDPLFSVALSSSASGAVRLDSLRLGVDLTDPRGASQAQLDSQIDSLMLYIDSDGDSSAIGATDSLVASALTADGSCLFSFNDLQLTGQGHRVILTVVAAVNADAARNGNGVGFSLDSAAVLYFDVPVTTTGTFPIAPAQPHTIDLFPAGLARLTDVDQTELGAGSSNQPVLNIHLPGNGYAADVLSLMVLQNVGSLDNSDAIASLKLWADLTGDGFSPDDKAIGLFLRGQSDTWSLSGANYAISPDGGNFVVTAEIAAGQFESGQLQLQIPLGGIRYASGLIGPDDLPVTGAAGVRIYPADRITVISVPIASSTVRPGTAAAPLMSFALYNGYGGQDYNLLGINFVNTTHTASTTAYADHELGQVSLYSDADNNRILAGDPLVASGLFVNGKLQFKGMSVSLPADMLSYFFVTSALPLDLIDGDSLDIMVAGPSDLSFGQQVVINGDLPLTSGGFRVVDGSVKSQYRIVGVTPGTLSPGDTQVPVFGFKPAINGDLADILQTLAFENSGDADTSDIGGVELWQDADGNGAFDISDTYLSTLDVTSAKSWSASSLTIDIDGSAPTLFVVADILGSATVGTTIGLRIPMNGVGYESANDGPRDAPLIGEDNFSISASALAVSYKALNATYTEGQTIEVRFTATNRLVTALDDVVGLVVGYEDSDVVTPDSSSAGPLSLASGASGEFVYYYTADTVGTVSFQVQAVAPVSGDSSAIITTNQTAIRQLASDLPVLFTNSIPTAVTRGQSNVFPFSLGLANPGSAEVATVRLDSLRLSVRDGDGLPLEADEVFARIALSSGYSGLAVLDPVPSQSVLTLRFAQPILIAAGEDEQLSLLVDIDSLATADGFAVGIENAANLALVDDNSDQNVTLDPAAAFPFWTAGCRVDDPSQQMAVSFQSLLQSSVNVGQSDVDVLQFDLRHPGSANSSQIQLTDIRVQAVDLSVLSLTLADLVEEITVLKRETVIGEASGTKLNTTDLNIELSSPITLSPGESETIRLAVSLAASTSVTGFSFGITDSTSLVVRDLSSGSLLQTTTDTTVLATGSAFPVWSDEATLKLPAVSPDICLEDLPPSSTVGGVDSLPLIGLTVQYPSTTEHSSLCTRRVLVRVMDTLGAPLDPGNLFDRIGYRGPDGILHYQQFVLTEAGAARFELGADGITIAPGDSVRVTLIGDITVGSAIDHFILRIESEADLGLFDATDTSSQPPLSTAYGCSAPIPFTTSGTRVFQSAGQPGLTWNSLPVIMAHQGQSGVLLLETELVYDNPLLRGDINLESFGANLLKRTATGLIDVRESTLFEGIYLYLDDQLTAIDTDLTDDSLVMVLEEVQSISQGTQLKICVVGDLHAGAPLGNYVVRCEDSSFVRMTDANLSTAIYPAIQSGAYPLASHELSLAAAGLEGSLTNYPNPFNPGEGATTIGYVLEQSGQVDIDLFSITGSLVKRLVVDEARPAGPNSVDSWTGQNGAGETVAPGTYYCRVTVRYADGAEETVRRKVAVIR